ncbi:peroxisomal (S)-2-hydroxy-acid oxidase isoform X3 [Cephus cinctus]|uniref:(S)-2-hydroxy-acid oxidase n=1 Tax=Cephus cinctus TaxID=211228 RepID=A0AAJ7RNA2_CEPCN|nr:peroxisomal (S)-2-hydroxy-acid oxidase isoform X3 [Cephus cinctus]
MLSKPAGAAGTIFILSTLSTSSIEEVAKAAPNTIKWFQLYVYNDRNVTQQLIQRAEKAGFKALVVTVDTPVLGNRHEDVRNKFSLPNHLRLANLEGVLSNQIQKAVKSSALTEYVATMLDETLNWQGIAWLKSITKLPIILKGILTAEDAILAVQHGASAILVSNHGGRQVDRCPSTIEALPEIVKAVGDKVEIYLDGGVRQGIDVFMALAIGARMVFFGRPVLWGLTHDGEKGVTKVLQIMREEISLAFALTGCKSLRDITRDMIIHESYYHRL